MFIVSRIVSDAGLLHPDGRPLHLYRPTTEIFDELEKALCSHVARGRDIMTLASAFVFWAAEHIRARFRGGPLTWTFVLEPIGLPPDDQGLGRELAGKGLSWWQREIRVSNGGVHMFLYSLMAEGGIPEVLLKEPGLYRDIVMGLLAEIESEDGLASERWSEQIASRWVSHLPQTFRNADIGRLLAALAVSLAELRAALPADLPEAAAEQWLNKHRPDWISDIPLRMTPEIAESLIRPALRTERDVRAVGPLCGRELRRGGTGVWHGYLILYDNAWLPARHFPDAEDLRLRLLAAGAESVAGVSYSAAAGGRRLAASAFREVWKDGDPILPGDSVHPGGLR